MDMEYVHGYHPQESERLASQAGALGYLLHSDTRFPPRSTVLEAGCGTGAQTTTLARNNPQTQFTCVDRSARSLAEAQERTHGLDNVTFQQGDLFALPFAPASFDHVLVCFVLEHLPDPVGALAALRRLLKPAGTITVIEGDHGSAYFHPDDAHAREAIRCQIELQRRAGGNALIGRELRPLLLEAGFDLVQVSPRMVHADAHRPDLVDGFTRRTFTPMVDGVRDAAINAGLAEPAAFDAGIRALHRTTEPDGVFCYTFFKALGRNMPETGVRRGHRS